MKDISRELMNYPILLFNMVLTNLAKLKITIGAHLINKLKHGINLLRSRL